MPGAAAGETNCARDEPRVNRDTYHYFVRITLPPRPDDVRGILRVNAVEIVYDK